MLCFNKDENSPNKPENALLYKANSKIFKENKTYLWAI